MDKIFWLKFFACILFVICFWGLVIIPLANANNKTVEFNKVDIDYNFVR